MNCTKTLALAAAVLLVGWSVGAQNTTDSQNRRVGTVVVPEKPTVTDGSPTVGSVVATRPERPPLPPEVLKRVERFKQDARNYLAKQEALKKQLKGANDRDRAAIRDQLSELRSQWLERAKEMRKEYKERQTELAEKLSEYRELLDNIRSTGVRDSNGRPRRGDD